MKVSWRQSFMSVVVIFSILTLTTSCGADRQLTSITVEPQNLTFCGAGLTAQFKAYGNYTQSPHPPVIKDVTNQVIWASDSASVITIDSTGLATSQFAIGSNIGISATIYSDPSNPSAGKAIVGRTTVNVNQPPCS